MQVALISQAELEQLIESIWSTMLGLAVNPAGGQPADAHPGGWAACVHITGGFNGTVMLISTERFARRATAAVLGKEEGSLPPAEIDDALGELCNIIAGGVKSLLPGLSSLSLPTITRGCGSAMRIPRSQQLAGWQFQCDEEPLEIRILAAAPAEWELSASTAG